jgi:hypothetical protein
LGYLIWVPSPHGQVSWLPGYPLMVETLRLIR